MRLAFAVVPLLLVISSGCGPSAHELREKTLSVINVEADRWDGGKDFATTATDAYGKPLSCKVEKTTLSYVLEVRSAGPDGLPKNNDDVVITRSKQHGETTVTEEAARVVERLSESGAGGAVKGIKKELGFGGEKK